jgi:hypothetical protein
VITQVAPQSPLSKADPDEVVASARRLAAIAEELGCAARELTAASGLVTVARIGTAAPNVRGELGALAASLRRLHDTVADAAGHLIGHARILTLAQGGEWSAGDGQSRGSHPIPTWSRLGVPPTSQTMFAESVRRTEAALLALYPDHVAADVDQHDVAIAMRRQIAARLDGYKAHPVFGNGR